MTTSKATSFAHRALTSLRVRLQRRLESLRPSERIRARRDVRDLVCILPALANYPQLASPARARLSQLHAAYVRDVSSRIMAASLEVSTFLRVLAECVTPGRIVDLGSGLSSLVLRQYAASAVGEVEVWSVDDDAHWLERTRLYLAEHGMDITNLMDWDTFCSRVASERGFDLVFHDAGTMSFRGEQLETVLSAARPGAWIVLDDMHKREYRQDALKLLARRGLHAWSLRQMTLDGLTRFGYLARVPDGTSRAVDPR